MKDQLEQNDIVGEAPLEEEEEFVSVTVLASMHQGTKHLPVAVWLYKNTGVGYRELADGTCALILKEEGYLLCRFVLATHWQAQEACRRLAHVVNFQVPASQLFSTYFQVNGEKLRNVIIRIFIEVLEQDVPQPLFRSDEEHLQALKDNILERGDPDTPIPPLLL